MAEWRDVPGYNGYYRVSDDGRVTRMTARGPVELTQSMLGGYLSVSLGRRGETVRRGVHRLMGLAFLPNPDSLPQVRHLDDVKTNNVLSNLAWGTVSQNAVDSVRNGTHAVTREYAERTHCKKGLHERTPENLVTRTKPDGRTTQTCKPCELERTRQSHDRNRDQINARAREARKGWPDEKREQKRQYLRDWHQKRRNAGD